MYLCSAIDVASFYWPAGPRVRILKKPFFLWIAVKFENWFSLKLNIFMLFSSQTHARNVYISVIYKSGLICRKFSKRV